MDNKIMRIFNNMELLKRIEDNPLNFIAEKKVNLLFNYICGYGGGLFSESVHSNYEGILLKLMDKEILKQKYIKMPSMGEYAVKKYLRRRYKPEVYSHTIIKISGKVNNELEYYDEYIQFIKEYEQKYLVKDKIEFIINDKPKITLKNVLGNMKNRWSMFFGDFGYYLENLRAFLEGYIQCKNDYSIEIDDFEKNIIHYLSVIKPINTIDIPFEIKYKGFWLKSELSELEEYKKEIAEFFNGLEENIGEKF